MEHCPSILFSSVHFESSFFLDQCGEKPFYLLKVDTTDPLSEYFDETLLDGTMVIETAGYRETGGTDELYSPISETTEKSVRIRMIPYHKWANCGSNEMEVWLRRASL